MRKKYFILLFLAGIISACQTTIVPPTSQPFIGVISSTFTQSAYETLVGSLLTPIPSSTPAPTDIAQNKTRVFRDEFDGNLQPGWEWINENPETWSLFTEPGTLQIKSEPGYINLNNEKNFIIRDIPSGDFFLETSLNFSPDEADQFAGLVLYSTANDFIQTGLGYCSPSVGCIGRGLYIDIYKSGNLELPRKIVNFTEDIAFLQIYKVNNLIKILASPNGSVWYRIVDIDLGFAPAKAGLFTGQNNSGVAIPATFGYFDISIPK